MPHAAKARVSCPLCVQTGQPKTRGDVTPHWVRRTLVELGGDRPPAVIYFVCQSCQRRLARHFEDPASALMKPMLAGKNVELTTDQQLIVARWLAKTLLLRLLKDAEHPIIAPAARLDRRRHALRKVRGVLTDLAPPSDCVIRIGRIIDAKLRVETPLKDRTYLPADHYPRLDAAGSGTVGALYWEAFFGKPERLAQVEQAAPSADWYRRVWPPQPTIVRWPPSETFNMFDFVLLLELRKFARPPGTQMAIAEPAVLARDLILRRLTTAPNGRSLQSCRPDRCRRTARSWAR